MLLFVLLLTFSSVGFAAPAYPESCIYAPADRGELQAVQGCAYVRDGIPVFSPETLAGFSYNQDGLAEVMVAGRWHWARRDGHAVAVMTMDNGADPFQEGLVRGDGPAGVVFYNVGLMPVLTLRYDWASPFEHGLAVVCSACVRQPSADGEHVEVVGGKWGVIGRGGKLIGRMSKNREAVWARRADAQEETRMHCPRDVTGQHQDGAHRYGASAPGYPMGSRWQRRADPDAQA